MLLCEGVRGTKRGENKFLKDGFTDISNCFDSYYSVSTEVAEQAKKLEIFVDKEGYGSCIREALPPISAAHKRVCVRSVSVS